MHLLPNRDIDWKNPQKIKYVKQNVLVELKGLKVILKNIFFF